MVLLDTIRPYFWPVLLFLNIGWSYGHVHTGADPAIQTHASVAIFAALVLGLICGRRWDD